MHMHFCRECGATIETGVNFEFDCDIEADHDFGLCNDCERVDVSAVEYYDQLSEAERLDYRNGTIDLNQATIADLNHIDAGLKAHCLS